MIDSSQRLNLTNLALVYLNLDVEPFEKDIEEATKKARSLAKTHCKDWMIAKEGLSCMPSAKTSSDEDKPWKLDMWLPRAFCRLRPDLLPEYDEWTLEDNPEAHKWFSACSEYANPDSTTTLALKYLFDDKIAERNLGKILDERMKILPIVKEMESNGITLSEDRLEELYDEYSEERESCSNKCESLADTLDYKLELPKGASANNSVKFFCFGRKTQEDWKDHIPNRKALKDPQTEQDWLDIADHWDSKEDQTKAGNCRKYLSKGTFEVNWLDLPILKTTAKGSPSLDKSTKEEYSHTLPQKSIGRSFIKNLNSRGKLSTAISYLETYRKFSIRRGLYSQLYSSLNPTGTHTLRWSSKNPNQQQVSKQSIGIGEKSCRYVFGPAPGREWWSIDYDNLELRIPAYECKEPAMLELFEHPNKAPFFGSYHMLIVSILYKKHWKECLEEVGKESAAKLFKQNYLKEYGWIKNGNFAEMYGAVDRDDGLGTADAAFHIQGAQSIISERLSEKSKLNSLWISRAQDSGYIETMPDTSIDSDRGYPLICPKTRWGKVKPTIPLNYHVQGTACWVIMRAMIKLKEFILEENLDAHMVMQVHDELVFDLPYKPNKGNEEIVKKFSSIMSSIGKDIKVSLTCGIDYHPSSWGETCQK